MPARVALYLAGIAFVAPAALGSPLSPLAFIVAVSLVLTVFETLHA